ncbi:MAG: multifunctional oxoglutarate decarboxylase/oxoglutarate dehydrogenase thiamine pyrophosphate-binding subunit/dihydrolipoyllysine-residue succinyltransferase subunit [Propionibacteriaceae bacterium]
MTHDNSPIDDFGANDWLINDMYERYLLDPTTLDQKWIDFFQNQDTTPPATSEPLSPPAAINLDLTEIPNTDTPVHIDSTIPATPVLTEPTLIPAIPIPAEPVVVEKPVPRRTVLRGATMRAARNMEASISVPTATTVRAIPMKLVIETRTDINNHLARHRGGKLSFTHLIAYAMVQAIKSVPTMNNTFTEEDNKAILVESNVINLGLAIDVKRPDGTRNLVVPNIKDAGSMDFSQFWDAYENLVAKGRTNSLTVDDFSGTTASITNPGGLGTNHSMARLMNGQSMILGVGNIDYPAEFQGTNPERLDDMAISKITTFTSTYDHRVIQGAQSGEFLRRLHELLLGADNFYDDIYESLRIPYQPMRWATDSQDRHEDSISKQSRVLTLIDSYRCFGHLAAAVDPLAYRRRHYAELDLEAHGLTIWDLDRVFATGTFGHHNRPFLKLREILEILRDAYCRFDTVEYMHIPDVKQRTWIQDRVEHPTPKMAREEQLHILDRLNEAEIFETFLQTKFVGQKRFSLEGGESAIVCLDEICQEAADANLDEVCIGMPHRGRLSVLTNIVGKSYAQVFCEFEETLHFEGTGDVKYHLGAEGEFVSPSGNRIRASVAANPSHLEAVNPVVEGIARAKQDRLARDDFPVLPLLLHGDASFSGQGVNFETLQMSRLRAYQTGGTIHVVINNQVGFTTSPLDARSSTYCTDVAKAIDAPVFHVNGDQPEAVARIAKLAFDYRQTFHRDVVIDLVCYRRRGHNEGDDPSFTQPKMYDLIEAKHSVRSIYTDSLIGRGDLSVDEANEQEQRFRQRLEKVFSERSQIQAGSEGDSYMRVPYYPEKKAGPGKTAITQETMNALAAAQVRFPNDFAIHPKMRPQLERRAQAILNGPIDWATAELLALGSLAMEGRPVRLTGQDARRGTFSQRFAAALDRCTGEAWIPFAHITEDQASFEVYDSLLSEYAAMGFEYGYSVARPDAIVLWEAQFGDFANGAQTISDEFIASGKAKWGQNSGIVLLLPHGLEGQGPDHSSARLERWLQLCSEGALAVNQPSTPASYFHLLRTHAYVNWHRPVVIATPKSMLRNKIAVSMPQDFTNDSWHPAFGDSTITDPRTVERIILCSGKIRWDLLQMRADLGLDQKVAIISIERLYPLPTEELATELAKFPHISDVRWVQDEPANQGAWPFMALNLPRALHDVMPEYQLNMTLISRPRASAPSVGSHHVHTEQQDALLRSAFTS